MSIIRVKKDEKYFSASNEPFVDKRLSWEARGLMGYLLTKPNNWQVRTTDIEKQGPAGNHKIRRMLSELRMYGYMNRIRIVNPNKTFDWITEVYESPSQNPTPNKSVIRASSRKSTSGRATSGKVPDIVKTDKTNTDPSKKGRAATPKEPTPPEILVFREVTRLYPPKVNWESVVKIVQSVSKRLGRPALADDLRPFFEAWTFRGYKPNNINWTSWAVSGVIPQNGKQQQPSGMSKTQAAIAQFLGMAQNQEIVDVYPE